MVQPWFDLDIVESATAAPIENLAAAVRDALVHPLPSPDRLKRLLKRNAPLSELADDAASLARKRGATAVIAVTDLTRACPDDVLVPPLLDQLNVGGIPDERITVIVAVGLHRATT